MPPITLYTTRSCPYCHSAKRLLAARGYAYEEVDLSQDHQRRQELSRQFGGYRTVPMIVIGERFIGGYDQLAELDRAGRLEQLVRAAAPPAND